MPVLTRHRVRAGAGGVTALGLALAGLIVGGAAPASAGARDAASTAGPPPTSHFLCYVAKARGFKRITGVQLQNVIQPTLFTPAIGAVSTHCNPATKTVQQVTGAKKTYPALNPRAHLLCWSISSQTNPVAVRLSNQFGSATMTTSTSPKSLCAPSWKKRSGPPRQSPNQPPGLDHFTCYGLTMVPGAYAFTIPPVVKVQDEFNAPKSSVVKLGTADTLCVPTSKVYRGKVDAPATPRDLSLVCFPSSPTPYWKSFFDQNQFGTGTVLPTKPTSAAAPFEELCLPSNVSKVIAG
jgi:hypothetical protein